MLHVMQFVCLRNSTIETGLKLMYGKGGWSKHEFPWTTLDFTILCHIDVHWRHRGIYCLHLQGAETSYSSPCSYWFALGSFSGLYLKFPANGILSLPITCCVYFSILKMEAVPSSETLLNYQITWRHIQDNHIRRHFQNVKLISSRVTVSD
jgi:hypothetical protein